MNDQQKKPFYKKWWFITLVVIIILGSLGSPSDEMSKDESDSPSAAVENTDDASSTEPQEEEAQYLMKDGDFALVELDSKVGEFGNKYAIGVIKNLSKRTKGYVQVEINLFDKDGVVVGSTLANMNNLEGGQSWRFEAIIMEDSATRFEVKGITGF